MIESSFSQAKRLNFFPGTRPTKDARSVRSIHEEEITRGPRLPERDRKSERGRKARRQISMITPEGMFTLIQHRSNGKKKNTENKRALEEVFHHIAPVTSGEARFNERCEWKQRDSRPKLSLNEKNKYESIQLLRLSASSRLHL